jgi:uncharacterized protein
MSVTALEPIYALLPQILLLGSPETSVAAPRDVRAVCTTRGIALEVMELGAACRTFNILVQEERRVAAALFLKKEPPEKKAT